MIGYYDRIFDRVEFVTCTCVSAVTGRNMNKDEIYSGKTKTLLQVSIARSIAFMVMHDTYGIRYSKIAHRAGMSDKAVMKSTARARIYRFSDPIYKRTYELMMNML